MWDEMPFMLEAFPVICCESHIKCEVGRTVPHKARRDGVRKGSASDASRWPYVSLRRTEGAALAQSEEHRLLPTGCPWWRGGGVTWRRRGSSRRRRRPPCVPLSSHHHLPTRRLQGLDGLPQRLLAPRLVLHFARHLLQRPQPTIQTVPQNCRAALLKPRGLPFTNVVFSPARAPRGSDVAARTPKRLREASGGALLTAHHRPAPAVLVAAEREAAQALPAPNRGWGCCCCSSGGGSDRKGMLVRAGETCTSPPLLNGHLTPCWGLCRGGTAACSRSHGAVPRHGFRGGNTPPLRRLCSSGSEAVRLTAGRRVPRTLR